MKHEPVRTAWLDALRSQALLSRFDFSEDLIDIRTMARKHSVRIGLDMPQYAEPFLASMRLGWTWTPVHSARTYTNEDDMLSELLGREQADTVVTEPPWVRVDIEMHATLPFGNPLRTQGPDALRRWTREATRALEPTLRTKVERNAHGVEAVHACLGEPEARVQWNDSSELLLLGVELASWRGVELPRASDVDSPFEADTATQLQRLAVDAHAAFAAWTRSLMLLLPKR
jgi:hypothetical protein